MSNLEQKNSGKLTRTELIFLVLMATATITVVSTCSPLYPFNLWDDVNCFFTLGRGIIHGKVPYRDLYEQKGPLLYLIYALAALISEKTFVGAWIIESVMASVFSVFSWKTAKLFVTPARFTIALVPVLTSLIYTVYLFNFGGNAEELCFPLITVAFYTGLRSIVKGDGLPENRDAVVCGLITAALFWIKYTFTGFMAGFCIYILILAVKRKSFARLWSLVWRFLCGFTIVTVPIILYFLVNGSVKYLWEGYFYNNIFLYHNVKSAATGIQSIPVINNIYITGIYLIVISLMYPIFGVMLILTVISLFFTGRKNIKKILFFFGITFLIQSVVIYLKPNIYYYSYILSYCFCLILIPLVKGINALGKLFKNQMLLKVLTCALLLAVYSVTLLLNKNMFLIFKNKEDVAQYRIAQTINKTSNAKVLTYDVMDSGFFTAAGVLPQNRFFCYLNIEHGYPAVLEEQKRLISEGYFDYIVTGYSFESDWENYEEVQTEQDSIVDFRGTKRYIGYKLYKRI